MKYLRIIKYIYSSLWFAFLLSPSGSGFSKLRIKYYNKKGCEIDENSSISPNVRITGRFKMDSGSSIAQNCTLSGEDVGIFIGKDVMIAPNVVIVAFNHGYSETETPMVKQKYSQAPIHIENNVWISANCTIGKGVRIGEGSIIAANSFVNKNIPSFSIAGGTPVKIIKNRMSHQNL